MNKVVKKVFSSSMMVFLCQPHISSLHKAFAMESIQNVVTKNDECVKNALAATPEQQKEIVNYCYKEVEEYWKHHDPSWAWNKDNTNDSPDVDKAYEEFFGGDNKRTYKEKIDFDNGYYNKAKRNSKFNWDSKIVAGHMAYYLREKELKHRYVHFDKLREGISQDCLIYAVNEESKSVPGTFEENWYVLDMQSMRETVGFKLFSNKKEKKEELEKEIGNPKIWARIPLEVFADMDVGFKNTPQVFVYGDSDDAIVNEYGIDLNAPLISQWVDRYATPEFKKKYFVTDLSDIELEKISKFNRNGNLLDCVSKVSRRYFVENSNKPGELRDSVRIFDLVAKVKGEIKKFPCRYFILKRSEKEYEKCFEVSLLIGILYCNFFKSSEFLYGISYSGQFQP